MSRRSPFAADALRELRRIANQFVTADPRRLFGPDGVVLRPCDLSDDIAVAIQELQFDKDGRPQRVKLLMRMTEAADGLPIDDQEQSHGRWQH